MRADAEHNVMDAQKTQHHSDETHKNISLLLMTRLDDNRNELLLCCAVKTPFMLISHFALNLSSSLGEKIKILH